MCCHVSGMEQLAYKLGMIYVVCHARLSGDDTILCDLSFIILCDLLEPHGARGVVCAGNLSTASGDRLFGKL
jgi:hypothetical protein